MTLLPFRAGRRALSPTCALALAGAFLVGTLALGPYPALALRQDAKTDDKKDEKTYSLVRTFKAKDVNHYKLHLNTAFNNPQLGGDVELVMTMVMKETTKEVKDNGTAILVSEFDSANVTVAGTEQDLTSLMPSVTNTVDKTGRVLDTKLEGGNPMFTQGPGASMFKNISPQTYFPPKAVKIGDTWKIDSSADTPNKDDQSKEKDKATQKTTGTATLVGLETINGLQTLKIKMATDSESTLDNPMNPGEKLDIKAHTEGFSNVEMASGKLVKMTATSTTEGGPQGKMKVDVTFALVTDDKAKKDTKATSTPDKPKN